jgi:hypothetical protein
MLHLYPRNNSKVFSTAYVFKIQSIIDENVCLFCISPTKMPKVNRLELIESGYKRILMATYHNIRKDDLKEILSHFIEDYPNINGVKFKSPSCKRCSFCYDHYHLKRFHQTTECHTNMVHFRERMGPVLDQLKKKFAPKRKIVFKNRLLKTIGPKFTPEPKQFQTQIIDFVYAF